MCYSQRCETRKKLLFPDIGWEIRKHQFGGIFGQNNKNVPELKQLQIDIKKRWQEYREELYKNDLHHPDNYDGVITHLEPDILECEVKWALGSITMNKARGGDGIPVELFQILKDDVVKVLHSICQQIWKPQQWPQDWKRSVFIPIPKKGNAKEYSNYCTIALISHASKVILKILQARLQQYVNCELPDVQAGFRKGRGTRDQIANIHCIIKKAREFQNTSTFALLTMPKPLTVWITTNCGKFFKRRDYQTTCPASWEICMPVKKQQLEQDMEQQTCSKLGKEYIKAVYYHPAYISYMQSSVQFSSVAQSCPTLCDPMNCSTPGLPVHHKLPEFTQTHAHRVGDAIQPSHPLSSPSPPAPNPSQHQGLFQWVNSSHEVAKIRLN